MARIVPKLNLNKTPQLVDNNSLVFAKNIRLLKDNTIGPDTSLEEVETNTGDGIHHVVHHNAVTQQITKIGYSILDYDNVLRKANNAPLTNSPEFVFGNNDPSDTFDDNYYQSDKPYYRNVPEQETHRIACYRINDLAHPVWTIGVFNYSKNLNRLIETSGLALFIGIRKEICDRVDLNEFNAPKYFYFIAPKEIEGAELNNVFDHNAKFIVFNPVHQISTTTTVTVQAAYDQEWDSYDTVRYISQIVGLNNKVYFFKESNYIKDSAAARAAIASEYSTEVFVGTTPGTGQTVTFDVNEDGYVTRNGVLFQDSTIASTLFPNFNDRVKIFEYDEVENSFRIVECAWKYSGGEHINGCVSVNGSGEPILTICEYGFQGNELIPIKHINIAKCSETDDESFYTQAPNIPISNLRLSGRYIKNIPAGVYQFFIRYKIHNGFYTSWFPCSKELFAGTRKITNTLQGTLKHVDLHEDSNNSFVFTIEHLYPEHCSKYEQFQLGFIISSDGGVFARSWKHFDMTLASSVSIYFDYDKTDIEDISIDDLLETNYDVFNVNNVAQYKNKLYIANYIETDFNDPALQINADKIKITFDLHDVELLSGYYLNNIPLNAAENGIYTSFGDIQINNIYYDSVYCDISRTSNTTEEVVLDLGYHVNMPYYVAPPINVDPEVIKLSFIDSSDNTHDLITYSPSITLTNENYDTVINTVIDYIRQNIVGIAADGSFKINYNNTVYTISSFIIEYNTYGTLLSEVENEYIYENEYIETIHYSRTKYNKELKVNISLKHGLLTSNYVYNEYNTFLPFTKYDFYIHYVKQNGIVTNGYYIDTKEANRYCKMYKPISVQYVPTDVINGVTPHTVITESDDITDLCWYNSDTKEYGVIEDNVNGNQWFKMEEITSTKTVIVPYITNIECPEGYVSCFISYTKYGNNVSQGFDYSYDYDSIGDITTHKLACLELNCLLYNTTSNIKIKDSKGNTITDSANYYSSSATNPLEYLGGAGHVEFITSGETNVDTKCWLIIDANEKPYNKRLIKLTPFIKLNSEEAVDYLPLTDVNSPGYLCEIITLSRDYCNYPDGYYVSGNDIYDRVYDNGNLKLEINEDRVDYNLTNEQYVFSNYNLNYVSLTSDLTPIIRRYAITREGDTNESTVEEGEIVTSEKQLITLVNSLLASYSLELKSFYREYTRKLYQEYSENKIIKFDNTIRVSSVDVDEIYRYIYKFEATDYYNVPTHRGIITNLIAVANTLYSHCEHSLFKFTDNKTLTGQDEEVTLQENDIFNTGISEVFDAQYGYGGLKDREQSLITFNAYVFYDSVAKIIYAFGGEQQIANIGEPIQKIIDVVNPTDVRFVGDEINDRFFVNLKNNDGNVCLSFNFRAKSFIAIHDIDFLFGFHTRRHTYFIHENYFNDSKLGWSIYRIADKVTINDTDNFIAYQNCYTPSLISISDMPLPSGVNSASACIDVITNVQYEVIKALDYVNWICSEILDYGNNLNYTAEEELNRLYPGDRLRIYSDSSSTQLFELTDATGKAKLSNEYRNINASGNLVASKESWQYPKYNCGVFSTNYFRDIIKNGNVYTSANPDLFKYKQTTGIGPSGHVDLTEYAQRENLTQESSVIYGKYFVFRLIFNNRNFKIENVTFRMSDYGKTK